MSLIGRQLGNSYSLTTNSGGLEASRQNGETQFGKSAHPNPQRTISHTPKFGDSSTPTPVTSSVASPNMYNSQPVTSSSASPGMYNSSTETSSTSMPNVTSSPSATSSNSSPATANSPSTSSSNAAPAEARSFSSTSSNSTPGSSKSQLRFAGKSTPVEHHIALKAMVLPHLRTASGEHH